jgi:hypothetical protein
MALNAVELGYEYFPDPTKGRPVYFGAVYIGVVDLDPQIPANQLTIQYRQEDGSLVPATQPVLTGAGGVPLYNGSPVQIMVDGAYSIKVLNSSGAQVYYRADSSDNDAPLRDIITPFGDFTDLRANADSTLLRAGVAGHTTEGDGGGGEFWLDTSDTSTADDNGINIVDAVAPRIGTWKRIYNAPVSAAWYGATGTSDDTAALAAVIDAGGAINLGDITHTVSANIPINNELDLVGGSPRAIISAKSTFPGATDLFTINPALANEKRNWKIANFFLDGEVGNGVKNAFTVDLTAGTFLNKFTMENVISNYSYAGKFFELINLISNPDGLFTGVIKDCWSLNGYYLDNIGDSFILDRNTVSGAGIGVAVYMRELATASHVIIQDCNFTASGGALYADSALNLRFHNNQIECPFAFDGVNDAAVSITHWDAAQVSINNEIIGNNINTQNNPSYCIFLGRTEKTEISKNTLACNPSTGQHIVIDTGSLDTYIGLNTYLSSVDGTQIDARITDNGVGTRGIWKNLSIDLAGWGLIDAVNGFAFSFKKEFDGTLKLRGNLTGPAVTAGDTLATLPVLFRPKKVAVLNLEGTAGLHTTIQILPTGEIQFLTTTDTQAYFDGVGIPTD